MSGGILSSSVISNKLSSANVVCGGNVFKKSKKLADGISGSKLILMEDMGHAIMPSLHNEFSEIVVNYLQRK